MADVFISYKREDRDRIAPLARALEARGYSVWWDLNLVASQKFERQIKKELDAARCVIVVWTNQSVADDGMYVSEWVQIEANAGDTRGVLLPVQFDRGRQHWRHGQSQFAQLHDWSGDETARGFVELLKGITLHAGTRERPVDQELVAWQAAEGAQNAEAFRQFLAQFPQSRFAEIARGRAFELDEIAAWRALGEAPTVAQLANFLRRYPGGRFADDAEARIKGMEAGASKRLGAADEPAPPKPGLPAWAWGAGAAATLSIATLMIWAPWTPRAVDNVGIATEAPVEVSDGGGGAPTSSGAAPAPSAGAPAADFPSGSRAVYAADFTSWVNANQHGSLSLGFGNALVLEPNSNTWIGSGDTIRIPPVAGDFVVDVSFRIERQSPNASLQFYMSGSGNDASTVTAYLSFWDGGSNVYSLERGRLRMGSGLAVRHHITEETIAERVPFPTELNGRDWSRSHVLTLRREGGTIMAFVDGVLLRQFSAPRFDVSEISLSAAFASRIVVSSVEFRKP